AYPLPAARATDRGCARGLGPSGSPLPALPRKRGRGSRGPRGGGRSGRQHLEEGVRCEVGEGRVVDVGVDLDEPYRRVHGRPDRGITGLIRLRVPEIAGWTVEHGKAAERPEDSDRSLGRTGRAG